MSRLNFAAHPVEDFDAFLARFSDLIAADIVDEGEDSPAYVAAHEACHSNAKFEVYALWVATQQGV